jgi:hypothetical protein
MTPSPAANIFDMMLSLSFLLIGAALAAAPEKPVHAMACGKALCALGKLRKGIPVTVLDYRKPSVCQARTGRQFVFKLGEDSEESGEAPRLEVTELQGKECRVGATSPYAAFVAFPSARIERVSRIESKPVTDQSARQALDKSVRDGKILDQVLEEDRKKNVLSAVDYLPGKYELSEVRKFGPPGEAAFDILTYRTPKPLYGRISVLAWSGQLVPLTHACGGEPDVLALGGKTHVVAGSGCCECDAFSQIQEVFKIGPKGAQQIYSQVL